MESVPPRFILYLTSAYPMAKVSIKKMATLQVAFHYPNTLKIFNFNELFIFKMIYMFNAFNAIIKNNCLILFLNIFRI